MWFVMWLWLWVRGVCGGGIVGGCIGGLVCGFACGLACGLAWVCTWAVLWLLLLLWLLLWLLSPLVVGQGVAAFRKGVAAARALLGHGCQTPCPWTGSPRGPWSGVVVVVVGRPVAIFETGRHAAALHRNWPGAIMEVGWVPQHPFLAAVFDWLAPRGPPAERLMVPGCHSHLPARAGRWQAPQTMVSTPHWTVPG